MSASAWRRAGEVASARYGIVVFDELLRCGLTPAEVRYGVETGRLLREHRGVYRMNGAPRCWEGRAVAACLTAHPDAAISHRSAAHVWGLDGMASPGRVDVTVPRHVRPRRHIGVRITRARPSS